MNKLYEVFLKTVFHYFLRCIWQVVTTRKKNSSYREIIISLAFLREEEQLLEMKRNKLTWPLVIRPSHFPSLFGLHSLFLVIHIHRLGIQREWVGGAIKTPHTQALSFMLLYTVGDKLVQTSSCGSTEEVLHFRKFLIWGVEEVIHFLNTLGCTARTLFMHP
jgi:hypothetical protein